jgi:transposase
MAYRYGDRDQSALFPPCVDDFVPKDAAVRAYDAMVEALDFKDLGIELDPDNVGNPQYDPKAMLKLHLYGTAYGVRSSRKLEREVHYNISFIWLMGQLKPDHKTIAEFRRKNKKALKKVLEQCARMCVKLGLIEGNTLFVDGTKIRANAAIKNTWTDKRCRKALKNADLRIEEILKECDEADLREKDMPSLVKMSKELSDSNVLKTKVRDILKELNDENSKQLKKQHNTTDPECATMHSQKGTHAGYNAQVVVDEKNALIVSVDTVSDNNDLHQFASQIDQANRVLNNPCKTACADSGYSNTEELRKIDKKDITVIVPSKQQASGKERGEFHKDSFRYDKDNDCYICPEGHKLQFHRIDEEDKIDVYRISDPKTCQECRHFGHCTKSNQGRQISRLWNEESRLKFEAQYRRPEARAIYKLRKQKSEHPFGHIKRNLKFDSFLTRGRDGANAEIALAAACFNMARMITILGIPALIQKLQG